MAYPEPLTNRSFRCSRPKPDKDLKDRTHSTGVVSLNCLQRYKYGLSSVAVNDICGLLSGCKCSQGNECG